MSKVKNEDIKKLMKDKKVSQYDLSVELNVSEMTVFRLLRRNLSKEEKTNIIQIINELGC